MVFNENETLGGLLLAAIPAVLSVYFYFIREKKNIAVILLIISAFLLRMVMISLDPYLHEWDERYHALVAKNMMTMPFKPMLFTKHIMAYNPLDWAYMHIWVHKQPLFLWQMAISMKVFGVNTIGLRLPSAIMGTIMVWLTYDISRKWIANDKVAFIAAILSAFSNYTLELISGWNSLDHNDLAFVFYMTCCFWAFTRYVYSGYKIKWALLIGLFAGAAILNKWLVGLLIFGGWGLYLILSEHRFDYKKYIHIALSVILACVIFLPWQFYILKAFPAESAIAFEYNRQHLHEDLGHPGNVFYHIRFLPNAYHGILLLFLLVGISSIFFSKEANKKITISFIAMIVVIFSFFSLVVATKMPAFVYPVSSLMLVLMAYGIYYTCTKVFSYLNLIEPHRNQLFCIVALAAGFLSLKPALIIEHRSEKNLARNNKIANTTAFKNMDEAILSKYVILNTRAYENIELMYYKDVLAYHWYPSNEILDSLQNLGYKFAAFEYNDDNQSLPEYITNDKEILILGEVLK
ncbi:MAG TPA: glycosyltransferase family 39 protein [Saprospiraceae bacterium]|nr:glycosyltransferase family 39 protein [Saprospiraceae bacterium]